MTKLINKVLFINNRRTSMRLCLTEWKLIDKICQIENISRNDFIEIIENGNRSGLGLTYYTRLVVMSYFYNKSPFGNVKTRRHGVGCQSFVGEILGGFSLSSSTETKTHNNNIIY